MTGRAAHRRRMALLAVLAAARGRGVGRERIVGLLWPEHPGPAARHLLSESLYVLRKELGEDAFVAQGDELALNGDVVRCDVARFEEHLEAGEEARAVELYAGPFLDGFYVSDAPEFERWAEQERDRLGRAYAGALETLADDAADDALAAAEWWRRAARHDPYSSRIALRLMEALDAAGERAAALVHAEVHGARLREELEMEPDPDVEAFVDRLRAEPPARPPSVAGTPGSEERPPVPGEAAGEDGGRRRPDAAPATVPDVAPGVSGGPRRRRWPGRRWTVHPALWAAAITLVVAVVASLAVRATPLNPSDLSDDTYVVLPFADRTGGAAGALDGDRTEVLLHDALSDWQGIVVVDPIRARDAVRRNGGVGTLQDALRVARELGAGRVVWGELAASGGGTMLRAYVYDARTEKPVGHHHAVIPAAADALPARFARIGAGLLLPDDMRRPPHPPLRATSVAAWRAYGAGYDALMRLDLVRARASLAEAARHDRDFAPAQFWLVQARALAGEEPEEWKDAIEYAVALDGLTERERRAAGGLLALARERYPEACGVYGEMVARDSTDFLAWFGLGECHALDGRVVPDPASPSGWRFRGSTQRAIDAYDRALRLVPTSYLAFRGAAFDRLAHLHHIHANRLRFGFAMRGGDTVRFAAYPTLLGDTLAHLPHPAADFATRSPSELAPRRSDALVRNRARLLRHAERWVGEQPRDPRAREILARALEVNGRLGETDVRQGEPSALSEVAAARLRAGRDPELALRLARAEVRLRIRVGGFAAAGRIADSLLVAHPAPGTHDAQSLAPLAALRGDGARLQELLRTQLSEHVASDGHGGRVVAPRAVERAAMDVLARYAVGDSSGAEAAEATFERELERHVEPDRRNEVRSSLLRSARRTGSLAALPAARRRPLDAAHTSSYVPLQQALAVGDTAAVRRGLRELRVRRRNLRTGDVALDFLVAEAELELALGDVAAAELHVQEALEALPVFPDNFLDEVPAAAALLRAMHLRAGLAARRGDGETAREWRSAARALSGGS